MTLLIPIDGAKTASAARRRRALFDEAAAIIDQEYSSQLTLTGVARRIGASNRGLQRAFAEIGETSFRARLREVRMRRAAELLQEPGVAVKAVAFAVGYTQPGEFARQFRAFHGRAPSTHRVWRRAA